MRHASHQQTEVKVAVISAQASSEEAQRQQLQETIFAFLSISALASYLASII